jgi:hypothetical protein
LTGTSLSASKSAADIIGPGSYSRFGSIFVAENKPFTIGTRPEVIIEETPGPGLYENIEVK